MANANIDTKQAVAEINKLIKSFNLLIKASGDVSTISKANFKKVEEALSELKTVSDKATASANKMTNAQKQQLAATRAQATHITKLSAVTVTNAQATQQAAAAQAALANKLKATSGATSGLVKGVRALISAFGIVNGIQLFANIIKNAYSLAKQLDSINFALERIAGNMFDAATSQRFLKEITQDFGVELVNTTERWVKFLAAAKQSGVTLKDTEDIFRSVTKAGAVLGLQTDDMSTVYLALEQMMSKGKITTEELRRQLGEKLPGAIGIMAAAVGVGVEQLDGMLKKGELLSADVLPKFARALELAYDIENVEKIDTITAAQNRLTNAWENFIKNVTSDSSWLSGTLEFLADGFTKIANSLAGDAQKFQNDVIEYKKALETGLFEASKAAFDKNKAQGEKYADIEKKLKEANATVLANTTKNISKAQEDADNDAQAKLIMLKGKYKEEILEIERKTAFENIEAVKADYDKQEKIIADSEKKIAELKSTKILGVFSPAGTNAEIDDLNVLIDKNTQLLKVSTAMLEIYKKLRETPKPPGVIDPPKGKKQAEFNLSNVKDLTNESRLAQLNATKAINDQLLSMDKASYEERQDAAYANAGIELEIADTKYKEAIEQADTYYINEIEKRNKAIADGKKIIGDQKAWEEELNKNYADKMSMATTAKNVNILAIEKNFTKEQLRTAQLLLEEKINISDTIYNKDIIDAKNAYNASKKTADDQETLQEALTKITIEQANARIAIKIKELENEIATGDLTEKETASLIMQIEALKASIGTFKPEDEFKTKIKKLVEVLEFLKDATQALGELGSAIFDRKIENINAEIDAEKNKYDTLIGLAKNNKEEQVRLQTEKDHKLKALEAKRLREEQRRARFEKANALVQIALNTAIAISKVLGQTGIFGLAEIGRAHV